MSVTLRKLTVRTEPKTLPTRKARKKFRGKTASILPRTRSSNEDVNLTIWRGGRQKCRPLFPTSTIYEFIFGCISSLRRQQRWNRKPESSVLDNRHSRQLPSFPCSVLRIPDVGKCCGSNTAGSDRDHVQLVRASLWVAVHAMADSDSGA
jgi:hypothetical protein